MPSTSQCPYCGSTLKSSDRYCRGCGAPNEGFVAETERQIFLPKTIDELKEYCAERGMPLLKMRFFIGEDYRQPRAFGIYREGKNFIVYKNKADGTRAVRYKGPDEGHAVNELFMKLLDECHNRGIYPDGKLPGQDAGTRQRRKKKSSATLVLIVLAFSFLVSGIASLYSIHQHRNDGYYSTGEGTVYYHYGNDWYYTYDANESGYWYESEGFPYADYEEYSLGEEWDSDWGVSDFKSSSTYEALSESSSSSSSDYDSWDSSDTDWDSDW